MHKKPKTTLENRVIRQIVKTNSSLEGQVQQSTETDHLDDDWQSHVHAVQESMWSLKKIKHMSLLDPASAKLAKIEFTKRLEELNSLLKRVRVTKTMLLQKQAEEETKE